MDADYFKIGVSIFGGLVGIALLFVGAALMRCELSLLGFAVGLCFVLWNTKIGRC